MGRGTKDFLNQSPVPFVPRPSFTIQHNFNISNSTFPKKA